MQNHGWIAGVLEDLRSYSEQHDLKEMAVVLTAATATIEGLVRRAGAIPVGSKFEVARAV